MKPEAQGVLVTPDLLRHRAEVQPDGVAFIVDGAAELTYRQWDNRSNAVAKRLVDAGVDRGSRIGLLFGGMEWIDYAIAYFATLKTGATAVHLNADQPAEEIVRRADRALVNGMIRSMHRETVPGFAGWASTVDELECDDPSPITVDIVPEDIADIVFTSGTTGPAKAYTVPHGNATFGRKIGSMGTFGDAAYMLTMLQIATGSSATALNIATIAQAVTVLAPVADIDRVGQLIEKYRTGVVAITPWIANRIIAERLHETHDLSSVTMFACGSAPLPPARANRLLEIVPGATIASACSQSEASPALVVNIYDPQRPLSVGRPTPTTQLRIVDDAGASLPAGEVGEIWLQHPAPKRLYLDLPDINAHILNDGWYRTGDLGQLDADGQLQLFDRRADAIRTADGLVSSIVVEAALYEHPAVLEAAVFAVPADGSIQQIIAAVVLDCAEARDELNHHLAGLLTARELPARIVVLAELPRNSQNKVLKRQLRDLYG